MATLVSRGEAPARRYRRVPWSPRVWSDAVYLAGGIPAQLLAVLVLVMPWWSLSTPSWNDSLWHRKASWPILLITLLVIFLAVPVFTGIQRHRFRTTAGVLIPPQPPIPNRLTLDGIVTAARWRATWRQLAYHLLAAPALAAASVLTICLWMAGALYAFVYLDKFLLSPYNFLRRGEASGSWDLFLTLAGVAMLAAAPWVTAGVRALDATVAQALLGPSRAEELEHRVEQLTQTRAGVVDAADAERRRLERDLHDGTQQRLVSLAMNLGMAKAQATTAETARQAIAEAHEEAKAALAELRNLIRGLHPAVLEDRGLDAALSGVAARMPVPVRLTVDLPRRPAPVIEAVAYFVVSEGLANIVKHAQASQAEVFVQRAGDRLHIIVSDDGVGGADPARGTGLTGLANRASSVDGRFDVSSPIGGPTLISVDLPCVP